MILIVEDNLENAELLRLFLERKGGLECRICVDGEEIVDLCESGKIQLVVMDVQLNNTYLKGRPVSGVELTCVLKSNPSTRHIPVLIATAHAMREQREEFLKTSGAEGYFSKPVEDYDRLIAEIRHRLR
jgi:CheY-like chemotaxis protein